MTRLQIIVHLIRANGFYWFLLYLMERTIGKFNPAFQNKRYLLEINERLPGFNTVLYNYKEWSGYDWSRGGEEWTDSEVWKKSLIAEVMLRYIQPGKTVLEIGPGAGRWSEALASISKELILVDLTERSIAECRKRLQHYTHCRYFVNKGSDLSFLDDHSIYYIWSYDVFVHIAPADIEDYLQELQRVMLSGGIGIIHHAAEGGKLGGFRSSMTNELFCSLLNKCGFTLITQFDSWGADRQFSLKKYGDLVTVFQR